MKKFIFILIGAILMFCSCSTSVVKDIKTISNGEKIVKVESVNITNDFYKYTNEYIEHCENYEHCKNLAKDAEKSMKRSEEYMRMYESEYYFKHYYDSEKKDYEKYKSEFEKYNEELEHYNLIETNFINNGKQNGKLYVAKFKSKDEITGKYLPFHYYQIFSYDSDGSIHSIDTDSDMQIIFSVFPEAKKDLEKVVEYSKAILVDAFANIEF